MLCFTALIILAEWLEKTFQHTFFLVTNLAIMLQNYDKHQINLLWKYQH